MVTIHVTIRRIRTLLDKFALLGCQRPRVLLGVVLVLTGLSIALATQLEIVTDVNSLAPPEITQPYLEETGAWADRRYLFLIFKAPEKTLVRNYEPYLQEIRQRVEALQLIKGSGMRDIMLPRKPAEEFFVNHGLLLAERPLLEELEQKLSSPRMQYALERVRKSGRGFFGLFSGTYDRDYDPFSIVKLIRQHLPLSGIVRIPSHGEYLMTPNGKTAFLAFGLSRPADDFAYSKQLYRELQRIQQEAWQAFVDQHKFASNLEPVTLAVTGSHMIYLQDRNHVLQEFWLISLLALIAIALLFFLFFRELRLMFFACLAIVCAATWTIAFAVLTVGRLNLATVSVAAVTLGLGIDFAVHLLSRYGQERRAGQSHQVAVQAAWQQTGRAVVFGALTSATLFYLMQFSELAGFRQLGFLLGTGVLLTCLSALLLLPALLTVSRVARSDYQFHDVTRLPLLGKFTRVITARPAITLVIGAVVVAGSVWTARSLQFRFSETSIHSSRSAAWSDLKTFETELGTSLVTLPLIVEASDLEAALQTEELLRQRLDRLREKKVISAYTSLSQWLPSRAHQIKNLEHVAVAPSFQPQSFWENYFKVFWREGISSRHLEETYPRLIYRALNSRRLIDKEDLKKAGLGSLLAVHYREKIDTLHLRTFVYLPYSDNEIDRQRVFLDHFKEEPLYQGGKVRVLSGVGLMSYLEEIVQRDAVRIAWIGLIGVFLFAWLCLRRLSLTFISLLPLLGGGGAMLGIFALTGRSLDFINMLWIPMILGLGIDDGIHLLTRYREGGVALPQLTERVGRAILVTTLTTVASFGTFLLTSYPILRTAGLLIAIGMACVLVFTLVLIPASLALFPKDSA